MDLIRTYSEMILLRTFEERYEYLRLDGEVGFETFGFDRYLNQKFYHSREWKTVRDRVITRDMGCDLASEGREIFGRIYIHHMNPMKQLDIIHGSMRIVDPEFLVCVSHNTHNAIHYGDRSLLITEPIERKPNDTCPWKSGI